MADLFLDIRDRIVRAIVSDSGEERLQRAYSLKAADRDTRSPGERSADRTALSEGELAGILGSIRNDAGIGLDQVHIIIPSAEVQSDTHRLPRMPQQEALRLLSRKTAEKTGDDALIINITPMAIEQNSQEWLTEYVPSDTLRSYKKEFAAAGLKLKTVSTALDSTLHAVAHIRDSIFNAHAIYEINSNTIEAYYVSVSSLLLHETLPISDYDDLNPAPDTERDRKRRVFTILDRLYHVNSQYLAAHPMTPLQKVWLCGTDTTINELSTALQEAMDVETGLLSDDKDGSCIALKGFVTACQGGHVVNYMHPDLLRRLPLRTKTGLLVYIATALLAAYLVISTEYRHARLTKLNTEEKKALAAQKLSQATSAAFAKNLDLLRRLSGSQVRFYPVFRELAMSLPDGVYLDSFSYSSKDSHDTIDLSATFRQSSDLGTQKTLSRLVEVMDRSPYLHNHREPSVISATRELKKVMTVKFSCEVDPRDTAK